MRSDIHAKGVPMVLGLLRSSDAGLPPNEAARRLKERGPNTLPETPRESYVSIFLRQFKSPLIYLLLVAAALMWYMGEGSDALVIAAVLILNAVIGTIQEGRAQNTLHALKSFSETHATVLRGNEELVVPDAEVVVGDIIVLREGEKVPADSRVILARNLSADEAALTGESTPVIKTAAPQLRPDLPISEMRSMVFKGTHIVAGSGRAVVAATGADTELGGIAKEISGVKDEIPLQRDIARLSRLIVIVVVAMSVALFFIGRALGHGVVEMFATVVALAVSVVPEGLPVVMTLVLATGVWRMSKRNALVKRLQAVEALGQARVIAVDKTGTITKNEMVVQKVFAGGELFDISGVGYEVEGAAHVRGVRVSAPDHPDLLEAGRISALAASARVMYREDEGRWSVVGDPTEAALSVFARKLGFAREELEAEHPLAAEIPFDSSQKYHAIVHGKGKKARLSVVGAPEVILERSSSLFNGGKKVALTSAQREMLEQKVQDFSRQGLRVVALARSAFQDSDIRPEHIAHLTFVALVGMKDGLREGVRDALTSARAAGLRVVMITGDHATTARAVASDAGIFRVGERIMTGDEINNLSDDELAEEVERVSVFARVTPEHKLRIVTAYKKRGEIIAMTGDGVNDAPSLVAADLGVGMGKIGTEVAKEASDIVLLDDNFGSIVAAIEEGRNIYKTIKKVILYLFSTSVGEVMVIAGGLFAGLPLPLLPAQIIWLNLVTDGFPVVGLGMEPKDKDLLSEKFERPKKYLIDRFMAIRMFVMAIPMGLGTLILFALYLDDTGKALTISLTTLAVFQWFNALNCRSESDSIFTTNPFSNMHLVAGIAVSVALQLVAVYVPFMQNLLHTVPLSLVDWTLIVAVASTVIVAEEARKWLMRRLSHVQAGAA